METERKTNYGIEFLRILAVFFVLIMHILGIGGALGHSSGVTNHVYYSLEIIAYCAVDLFALITGFVNINVKWKSKRYIRIWTCVVWFCVVLFLVVQFIPQVIVGYNTILSKFLPVSTEFAPYPFTGNEYLDSIFCIGSKQYWYVNMYTLLFVFIPILNAGINKLSKRSTLFVCMGAILLTSVYKTIVDRDLFIVSGGYTAMWLIIMYVTGACVRKYYDEGFRPKKYICIIGIVVSNAIMIAWKIVTSELYKIYTDSAFLKEKRTLLVSYVCPFTVISAVLLLMLFMQIDVKNEKFGKIIKIFSGSAFGIYIIHVHTGIWEYYMTNRFVPFSDLSPAVGSLVILLTAVILFITCGIIEYIRQLIFKYTRFNKLIDFIGDKIDSFIMKEKPKKETETEVQS